MARNSARLSRQNEEAAESPTHSKENSKEKGANNVQKPSTYATKSKSASGLIQPLVMQFNVLLQSLSVSAALLPSLQAQYKMDHVTSVGISGYKAKFTIDLPNHTLSFTTKHHVSPNFFFFFLSLIHGRLFIRFFSYFRRPKPIYRPKHRSHCLRFM